MTSSFDSLNPFGRFRFSVSKTPLDWNKLVLDVDKIIATRDVQTLVSNLDILITCNIDAEVKRNGFSEMFIKLFRLSQLAIEFLLHCKAFLQNSLSQQEEEIQSLKLEILRDKQKTANEEKISKSQVVLTAAVKSASFKCSICNKIFVSDRHLEHHISKQHAQNGIQRQSRQSHFKAADDTGHTSRSCSTPNKPSVTFSSPDKNYDKKPGPGSEISVNKSEGSTSSHSKVAMRLEELLVNMEHDLLGQEENASKTTLLTHSYPDLNRVLRGSLKEITDKSNHTINRNNSTLNVKENDVLEPGVSNCTVPFSAEKTESQNVVNNNIDKNILPLAETPTLNLPPDGKQTARCHSLNIENVDNFSEIYRGNIFHDEIHNGEAFITDEIVSSTESETSSSSEDIDMNRLRAEIEREYENKLRSLGIDPEWRKIPHSVAKANGVSLSALRKSYAKKDKNYYTIRNQLTTEVDQQLQLKTKESMNRLYLRNKAKNED